MRDRLEGFEIKSDADSHARFGSQNGSWEGVFDYLTLVITQKHLTKILDNVKQPRWWQLVPEWWGLILADPTDGHIVLRRVREPFFEVARLQPSQLVKCFWKVELEVLAKKHLGWKSKECRVPKYNWEHWDEIRQKIGVEDLRRELRKAYLSRNHLSQRGWEAPKEEAG